jgi:oligopeptide/dipeptide ABC transporter ATP-binding protein
MSPTLRDLGAGSDPGLPELESELSSEVSMTLGESMVAKGVPAPLLEVRNLKVHFPVTKGTVFRRTIGHVKAVDDISFSIAKGEVLGLVGESGCGKTTVARTILKLVSPSAGQILFDGQDLWSMDKTEEQGYRRRVQAIFQDPYSSLNPRMSVRQIVGEPYQIHESGLDRVEIDKRVRRLLEMCGLPGRMAERYPHEMSGGQRQRVGIARALALNPDLIVCDEAVSALDVSIQAQIINLLQDLKNDLGLTYLFIGHDLSVVKHLCNRVAVMYLGKIAEAGDSEVLFDEPLHPYTVALMDAIPTPDPDTEAARPHRVLAGEIPSPLDPPRGCVFHTRCPIAVPRCHEDAPRLEEARLGHWVACPMTVSGRADVREPWPAAPLPSKIPMAGTTADPTGGQEI